MRALLLALSALVAAWRSAGQAATRCTARACFTLHEKAPFDVADGLCLENGGYLLTMKDEEEEDDARALLALVRDEGLLARGNNKLWIGLKLSKGSCVLDGEPLRGFRWKSSSNDSSAFTNWAREPRSTCTEERCVSVRLTASPWTARLDWSDGSCKESALYACRFHFKGMCEPLALAGPGEVTYTTPFTSSPLKAGGSLRMLPHGTFADINCTSSAGHIYPACKNAGAAAGFAWSPVGPFCVSANRSCALRNGGCDHVCSEDTPGGVRCSCREGYKLGEDTVRCSPRDACKSAPCEQKCLVMGSSFQCACRNGYRLAQDKVGCVDVNECEGDVCGGHVCHNRPGSYECACKTGYQKASGGACVDVDECAEGACSKGANCLNSQGSFSCYCSTGFQQADAGGGCVDVDECVSRPCEDICTNTVGSFACSCRASFRLADNGISCIQVVEPTPRASATQQPSSVRGSEEPKATTSATLLFSSEGTSSEAGSGERRESLSRWWVMVWVLGSVVPLLLLIMLTSIIAVLRWNRARRDAKKKSATADSYCWVSSGFQIQPDTEPH